MIHRINELCKVKLFVFCGEGAKERSPLGSQSNHVKKSDMFGLSAPIIRIRTLVNAFILPIA